MNNNFSNELINEVKSMILDSIYDYEDCTIEDYIMDEFNSSFLFDESDGDKFIGKYYKDFKTMLDFCNFNYGYQPTTEEILHSERMASLLVLTVVEDIMYNLYDPLDIINEETINLNNFKYEEVE